jgi:hypothetical protein
VITAISFKRISGGIDNLAFVSLFVVVIGDLRPNLI